jgi:hypothetical protein
MNRKRVLKVVLVLVGLLFTAMVYPLVLFVKQDPALTMMMSHDESIRHARHFPAAGSRDPSANRSLIAFTAWSRVAHAAVMSFQAFRCLIARGELIGSAVLVVVGVALIALAPGKQTAEHLSVVVV